MVVRHSGRNQNACKHTAAGMATAERSIWGQVLGTDFSRRVPMTCLLIRRVSLPPPGVKIASVLERWSVREVQRKAHSRTRDRMFLRKPTDAVNV
jgi:hypothetical protein